jgi:hypothetical protein
MTPKISLKKSIWVFKNAEFYADFEFVDRDSKKCFEKKFYAKNLE